MAACDVVTKFIQRVSLVSGGTIAVTFPTTLTALTEFQNIQVAVLTSTSTSLLPANASRRAAYILNSSSTNRLFLRFASGAAAATNIWIEPNSVYSIEIDSNQRIYQGEIRAFHAAGVTVDVGVIEFV